MAHTHKWNKAWKFNDETNNLIASIEAHFDVSDAAKRILRGRIAASGKTLSYTITSEHCLEAGAGYWFPSLTLAPHRLDKRQDIVEALEALGIENPMENILG